MKKFNNFFTIRVPFLSEITLHKDGFSLPGYFSLRLSNLPTNLFSMMQMLTTFQEKLLCSLVFRLLQVTRADQCFPLAHGTVSDVFLKQGENNSHLWLQHTNAADFSLALNNTCGFFFSEKVNVTYSLKNCFCLITQTEPEAPDGYYSQIYMYGYNIADQSVNCVSDSIKNNFCPFMTKSDQIKFILGLVGGLSLMFCTLSCLGPCWDRILALRNRFLQQPPIAPLNMPIINETRYSNDSSNSHSSIETEIVETPSPGST